MATLWIAFVATAELESRRRSLRRKRVRACVGEACPHRTAVSVRRLRSIASASAPVWRRSRQRHRHRRRARANLPRNSRSAARRSARRVRRAVVLDGYQLQKTREGAERSRSQRAVRVHQRSRRAYQARNALVISVDTRKKELVGDSQTRAASGSRSASHPRACS